jgi:hypothetical protein
MEFNLKNPLWLVDPIKARKSFEKELRKEKLRLEKLMDASDSEDYYLIQWRLIRKILGET